MMRTQIQLVLTAFIVNFTFTTVLSYNEMVDHAVLGKVNDEREVQESFQNLFNSIAKNDMKKSGTLREILKQEDAKERKAFVAMKVDLQRTQNRNTHKKRNFFEKINFGENVKEMKREIKYKYNSHAGAEWFTNTSKSKDCEVDAQFMKFHSRYLGSLSTKPWPLADNLTANTLKKVCDEVLADNPTAFRPLGEFSYIDPSENCSLQMERVVRKAPVVCSQGIAYVSLIYCSYNGTDFYLAEGNDTHVLRLGKDPTEDLYYFQSGAHEIHYNNNNS